MEYHAVTERNRSGSVLLHTKPIEVHIPCIGNENKNKNTPSCEFFTILMKSETGNLFAISSI